MRLIAKMKNVNIFCGREIFIFTIILKHKLRVKIVYEKRERWASFKNLTIFSKVAILASNHYHHPLQAFHTSTHTQKLAIPTAILHQKRKIGT